MFGVEKLKKAQAWKAEEKRKFDRFVSDLEGGRKTEPKVSGDEGESAMENELETRLEENTSSKLEKIVDDGLEDTIENTVFSVRNATVDKEKEDGKVVANLRENDGTALENLYRQAMENEQVRLRIIGDYLQSIGKGAPLMKGGVGATLAPPLKAKSFAEAGNMALRLFKGER